MSDNVVFMADLMEFLEDLETAGSKDADLHAQEVIDAMAMNVRDLAQKYAPEVTGELKRSIDWESGPLEARVYASAPHAVFIEFGTWSHNLLGAKGGTYEIRPRNAKALRFESQGRTVFAKSVRHPGIKPQPFMAPALEETIEDFTEGFANVGVMLLTGDL